MLMMSTRSDVSPSPFGSAAYSMPCNSATPLQELVTALQTLTAYSLTFGATPAVPPMMSATWVPWLPAQSMTVGPQSIGSASGASGTVAARLRPRNRGPATTRAVGKSPSRVVLRGSVVDVP